MKTHKKQIKKMVFNELDLIYSSSKKTASTWNVKTIPVSYIKALVQTLNNRKEETDNEIINNFIDKYKKLLNQFVSILEGLAKKMNSKSIPLTVVKEGLRNIKQGFTEGILQTA